MTTKYVITVEPVGAGRYLAKVQKSKGMRGDMRDEWEEFEVLAVALGGSEGDAIHDAVNEAFFS
jgi:hypothetical protein